MTTEIIEHPSETIKLEPTVKGNLLHITTSGWKGKGEETIDRLVRLYAYATKACYENSIKIREFEEAKVSVKSNAKEESE